MWLERARPEGKRARCAVEFAVAAGGAAFDPSLRMQQVATLSAGSVVVIATFAEKFVGRDHTAFLAVSMIGIARLGRGRANPAEARAAVGDTLALVGGEPAAGAGVTSA